MTSTTKLICPECHRENEAERIYCHSCGERLDRSDVAARNTQETVDETRQRVRELFDPQRAKVRASFFKISKLVLGACVVAAIVQMLLPPDVPAPIKTELLLSRIRFELENAATSHQPVQLQYTEEQINAFLMYALKTKQALLNKPLLVFKRAAVGLREGSCTVTAERSLYGYSLYTACSYAPVLKGGKIEAPSKGGSIGRLPIHPRVMQFLSVLFSDVWSALDHEIRLVRKMGGIEFHNQSVVLTSRPQ